MVGQAPAVTEEWAVAGVSAARVAAEVLVPEAAVVWLEAAAERALAELSQRRQGNG